MKHESGRHPARAKAADALARIELGRAELFELSKQCFAARQYTGFREQVDKRWRAWRDSPTALLLVGISYYHERSWDQARALVDKAENIWTDLGAIGLLDRMTLELVLSSLACCRAKIEQGQSRPETAERILLARIECIDGQAGLTAGERSELKHKPEQLLKNRSMLATEPMTQLALV